MPPQEPIFPQFLRGFFPEFLEIFFPEWAARLELASTEWMKPEQLPRIPGESSWPPDLIAKVPFRSTPEPNSSPDKSAAECLVVWYLDFTDPGEAAGSSIDTRVPTYHLQLRQQTGLPVLPLVIYGKAKGDCIGVLSWRESFFDLETRVVRCLYVALKGLSGIDYLATGNPIAVALAPFMTIAPEKVAWLGAEALRVVFRSNRTDAEKILLGEFIQANLPLDADQRQAFETLLATEPYAEIAIMNKTVYEQGVKAGLVSAVLASLEGRFDSIPQETSEKIAALDQEKLLSLLRAIPRADLIEDLPLPEDQPPGVE